MLVCCIGAEAKHEPGTHILSQQSRSWNSRAHTHTHGVFFLVHPSVRSEFQPQETGYMFGSSDRPDNDEERDEYQGHDIGDAVNAVIRRPARRTTSGDADGGDGGAAAWRLKFWQRQAAPATPTNAAAVAGNDSSGGRHIRSQTSFRHFFNRQKKGDVDLEDIDEQLANELEDGVADDGAGHRRAAASAARPPRLPPRAGRSAAPRPSPVRPQGVPADAPGGVVDLGDVKGGKLKAAVKRAMAAQRREKEAAARRGRQKRRQEQELGEFQGFIQVRDPALDKVCFEYGLTADLAESKYR